MESVIYLEIIRGMEIFTSNLHHKSLSLTNNIEKTTVKTTVSSLQGLVNILHKRKKDINEILKSRGTKCYYTKIQFNNQIDEFSLSFDRIDSGKGYTKENCRLVLSIVNYMKKHYSEEAFFYIIKQIYENCQLSKRNFKV